MVKGISKYINRFGKKVIKQASKLGRKFIFKKNKKRHQYAESECGVYCIFFIIQMIEGKKTFSQLMSSHLKDKRMTKLRKVYFNHI